MFAEDFGAWAIIGDAEGAARICGCQPGSVSMVTDEGGGSHSHQSSTGLTTVAPFWQVQPGQQTSLFDYLNPALIITYLILSSYVGENTSS